MDEIESSVTEEISESATGVGSSEIKKSTIASSGRRQSLLDIRRQLSDEELVNSGVSKLLLDMLELAEAERDTLKNYVSLYYEADKRAAVLMSELTKDNKQENLFTINMGFGGAIIGLSPFFWEKGISYGLITILIGSILMLGAVNTRRGSDGP